MLLAIDTATRIASIALYGEGMVLSERTWYSNDKHTVELMPNIASLLEQQGIAPRELSGIAVAFGPGSFTGLRIGMSVAKGLAFSLDIPLVGISTLEILAYPHADSKLPTCAIIQAGRGRICAASYRLWYRRWRQLSNYRLTTVAELCASIERKTLFCGEINPQMADVLRQRLGKLAVIASPASSLRRAGYLAELGWQRIEREEVDDPETLEPIYLRHPASGI